jgi:hypothetical protein
VLQLPVELGVGCCLHVCTAKGACGGVTAVHVGRCGAASELEPRNDARIGGAGWRAIIGNDNIGLNEVIENVLHTY